MTVQKFIPEVKFTLAPIKLDADLLYSFSLRSEKWKGIIDKAYPELGDILKQTKTKKEAIAKCQEFAEKITVRDKTIILMAEDAIRKDWDMISNKFLEALSEHLETEWPEDKRTITGYISILPIFPRFLDNYSFCVGHRKSTAQARETIAHEILHFLWFKKWKEVFPESVRSQYESPNLTWRLSEIMDPIILQCNPKIKELIKPVQWGYSSFKDIKIGDIGMTEYFVRKYNSCVIESKSFEDMLKVLWEEARKNKEVLEKF